MLSVNVIYQTPFIHLSHFPKKSCFCDIDVIKLEGSDIHDTACFLCMQVGLRTTELTDSDMEVRNKHVYRHHSSLPDIRHSDCWSISYPA